MKKIGILTYFKEFANIGTNMQSYCTYRAVQKHFPDYHVELINFSVWKPAMKPYLSHVSVHSLWNDYVRIGKYKQFFKRDLVFSKEGLVSSDLEKSFRFFNEQQYDAIYVGSDTILELKRAKHDQLTPYWLDDTIKGKKFMIAASSHNVSFENLTEKQKLTISRSIKDFSLLGVRDDATIRLLANFVPSNDKRLQLVPDPTFTYNIDYSFVESYLRKKKIDLQRPIVCLHLLRNTKWAQELSDKFRAEGYLIASFRPAYYADVIFTDLSPFEQVGLYKYFALVITHRFHDSIFAIKNLTPVIVYPEYFTDVTVHGENKNKTLFKSFDLESNYIEVEEKLNANFLFDIHRHAINAFCLKRDLIKERLSENHALYDKFLEKSKAILENCDQ